ncbi:MAG: hypothetical protein AAFR96_13380 [Planctomycetota bacterium]
MNGAASAWRVSAVAEITRIGLSGACDVPSADDLLAMHAMELGRLLEWTREQEDEAGLFGARRLA